MSQKGSPLVEEEGGGGIRCTAQNKKKISTPGTAAYIYRELKV